MTEWGTVYELERQKALGTDSQTLLAENTRLRNRIREACDLLAERTHGNPARSPGHNARLHLEEALKQS